VTAASGLVGAAPPLWGRRLSCAAVLDAATARLPATGRALGLRLAQAGWWVPLPLSGGGARAVCNVWRPLVRLAA
jgi:hypothetical protein